MMTGTSRVEFAENVASCIVAISRLGRGWAVAKKLQESAAYPLVNIQKAIENAPFMVDLPITQR